MGANVVGKIAKELFEMLKEDVENGGLAVDRIESPLSFVQFCDRCTKLATIIIPHKDGEERYCEFHWQARTERLVQEVAAVKASR
ncbi:MAG TPA: hypothetical protein VGS11_11040 [Candidatus Bathyarchaeia archaeon]|nr:hypothetical protein [Candidatus Bathyarchaeia archaeon]